VNIITIVNAESKELVVIAVQEKVRAQWQLDCLIDWLLSGPHVVFRLVSPHTLTAAMKQDLIIV
jgi:hypothetical protein